MCAVSALIRDSPSIRIPGGICDADLHDVMVYLIDNPGAVISATDAPDVNWVMSDALFNQLVPKDIDYVRLRLASAAAAAFTDCAPSTVL